MTRFLLCSIVAFGVLGCGASTSTVNSPANIPAQEAPAVAELEIPEGTRRPLPEVTLLDPGQAPLEPLRYTYQRGQQEMTVSVATTIQTSEMAVNVPELTLMFDGDVVAVDSRGWARLEATITAIEVADGPGAEEVRQAVQSMIGSSYWSIVCRRGFERARGGDMADQADSAASMVFPREPVGVGARWQSRSLMENGVTNVATYTLRSIEGTRLVIDMEIEQHGDNVVLNGTGGFQAEGSGGGETTVDTQSGAMNASASITVNLTGPATIQTSARTRIQASPLVPAQ